MSRFKDYMGDSVYADFDGYGIILTTETGLIGDPSNRIVLEPEVLDAIVNYSKRMKSLREPAEAKKDL